MLRAARHERNLLLRLLANIPDPLLFGIAKLAIAVDNYRSVKRQSRWLRNWTRCGRLRPDTIGPPAIGGLKTGVDELEAVAG